MQALFIYSDRSEQELNCSRYRVLTPAKYLGRAGHTIAVQHNPGWTRLVGQGNVEVDVDLGIDYTQVPETVVIERVVIPEWIEKLRMAGAKKIIVTFDDHYQKLPQYSEAHLWWDTHFKVFLESLRLADLVIVPSQHLVKQYQPYCRSIRYVPNFIDDDSWTNLPEKANSRIIGWGGSVQHIQSWEQRYLTRALARVLNEHPGWELHLCGESVPNIIEFFPPGINVQWRRWMPYRTWIDVLCGFQIGLAPLHGVYDRYRSNLKVVEYGLGGVPWVASNSEPYVNVRGGILVKEDGWYEALSLLMEDEQSRQVLAATGREWASGFLMSKNVPVYEDILWPS